MSNIVTFKMEVTNLVNPAPPVLYDDVKSVDGENLYKAMCAFEKEPGSNFSFVSILESLGHYITTINGLEQDEEKDYYWTIRIETLEHWAQEGVDKLYPKQGEKYIFAYTNFAGDHANKVKK